MKKLNVTPKKKENLCTTRPALLVKIVHMFGVQRGLGFPELNITHGSVKRVWICGFRKCKSNRFYELALAAAVFELKTWW